MELHDGFPDARGVKIEAVRNALKDAGIKFIAETGDGAGARVRKG